MWWRSKRIRRSRDTAGENLGGVGVACRSRAGRSTPDGRQDAPYDAILLEGASEVRPDGLLAQLKEGGRLVAVIGSAPFGKATLYRKAGGQVTALALFDAAAPLLPGFAKTPALRVSDATVARLRHWRAFTPLRPFQGFQDSGRTPMILPFAMAAGGHSWR